MIVLEPYEAKLAKQYNFNIKEDGMGHYIVRDPQMPKKKYVGGNVHALMLQAVDERKRLKTKVMSETTKVVEIKRTAKEKLAAPPPEPITEPETPPTPEPEPVSEPVVKSDPAPAPKAKTASSLPFDSGTRKGKLYVIKQVILKNPNFSVDQIMAMLKVDGYDIPQGTIATTRSDFLHSIRVIKDMNRWHEC